MLSSTFTLLLVVGHLLVGGAVYGAARLESWVVPLAATAAFITNLWLAVAAQNIETVTDAGVETTASPAVGIYCLLLAILGLIFAVDTLVGYLRHGGTASAY